MAIISSLPLAVNDYHTIDAGDGFFNLDIIAKQPISRLILFNLQAGFTKKSF